MKNVKFLVFGLIALIIAQSIWIVLMNNQKDELKNELFVRDIQLSDEQDALLRISQELEACEGVNNGQESRESLLEKIESLKSYADYLGSSIDDLLREIRWTTNDRNCNLWDIERKAKNVSYDYDSFLNQFD